MNVRFATPLACACAHTTPYSMPAACSLCAAHHHDRDDTMLLLLQPAQDGAACMRSIQEPLGVHVRHIKQLVHEPTAVPVYRQAVHYIGCMCGFTRYSLVVPYHTILIDVWVHSPGVPYHTVLYRSLGLEPRTIGCHVMLPDYAMIRSSTQQPISGSWIRISVDLDPGSR